MNFLVNSTIHWYKNPQWYQVAISFSGVVTTLLLAYIAIFGREKFFRLKFSYVISKIDQNVAGGDLVQFWRVKIKNVGKRKAKDVVVQVVEIHDHKTGKYFKREDFIHMPLHWTHYDGAQRRTIAVNEDAFVDLGIYDIFHPKLKLVTNPQTFSENLQEVSNNAKIILRISEAQGYVEEITLDYKMLEDGAGIEIIAKKPKYIK